MKPSDLARLRRAAELIDMRERTELARLSCLASGHKAELRRLHERMTEVDGGCDPGAAEAFRVWCRQQIALVTAALMDAEHAVERQMASAARAAARQRVLDALETEARRERQKTALKRALEVNAHPDGRCRAPGRPSRPRP